MGHVDITKLTTDELEYIMKSMDGDLFRSYFQKHPKGFSVIKPGFRPQKLSKEVALQTALKNMGTEYILRAVATVLDQTFAFMDQRKEEMIKDGKKPEEALLLSLKGSPLSERINLYFKLTGHAVPAEYAGMLQSAVNMIADPKQDEKDKAVDESDMAALNTTIRTQNTEIKEAMEKQKELSKEIEQNKADLADKDAELLKAHLKQQELDDTIAGQEKQLAKQGEAIEALRKLKERMDALAPINQYPYTSLCVILENNGRSPYLKRISDVKDGVILGCFAENTPPRDRIHGESRNGIGHYGVWNWTVEANRMDPNRLFFKGKENEAYQLTQIIWTHAVNLNDLLSMLIHGFPSAEELVGTRIFFAMPDKDGIIQAICCNMSQLATYSGQYKLNSGVRTLPVYHFRENMVFSTSTYCFYRSFVLDEADTYLYVTNPLEIVKNLFLQRIKWADMKSNGFTKNEYQHVQKVIREMKVADFYDEVGEACQCSREEAKKLVDLFIEKSDGHIHSDDISSRVIADIIQHNSEVKQKAEKVAQDLWENDHQEQMDAKEKLDRKIADGRQKLEDVMSEKESLQREYDMLLDTYKQKENLAGQIEAKVNARIDHARTQAADFISDMLMNYGLQQNISSKEADVIPDETTVSKLYHEGALNPNVEEEYSSYDDFIGALSDQLYNAGISDDFADPMAAYLYAAYVNRIPLILSGSNGQDIAKSFSAAYANTMPGVLNMDGDFDAEAMDSCLHGDDEIVVVNHPFNSSWMPYLPDLLAAKDKFVLLNLPYPEDLVLNSKEILNMALPLITAPLTDHKSTGKWDGGIWKKGMETFHSVTETQGTREKLFRFVRPSVIGAFSVGKAMLETVLTDFCKLYDGNDSQAMAWELALFPYAYANGRLPQVLHYIEEKQAGFQKGFLDYWKMLGGGEE